MYKRQESQGSKRTRRAKKHRSWIMFEGRRTLVEWSQGGSTVAMVRLEKGAATAFVAMTRRGIG